jgi:hypothetical protein
MIDCFVFDKHNGIMFNSLIFGDKQMNQKAIPVIPKRLFDSFVSLVGIRITTSYRKQFLTLMIVFYYNFTSDKTFRA